jgi:hypothetical protein
MKIKLTDSDGFTRRGHDNQTKWGENVTHVACGEGSNLCSDGVIHYYPTMALATLMNPAHVNIIKPIAWECDDCKSTVATDGTKSGSKSLTTIRQVAMPVVTLAQAQQFALECAKAAYPLWQMYDESDSWRVWASNPHDNAAAYAAANAAVFAAAANAANAADAATNATNAANAAYAAAFATNAADAANAAAFAAYAAVFAANAAAFAAYAAANAANANAANAANAILFIDFAALAEEALNVR